MAEDSLQTIWTAHTSPPPPPRPPSSPMRALPPSPSLAPHTSPLSLAPCRPSAAWSPPHPLSLSRMAALAQTPLPQTASSTAMAALPSAPPPRARITIFSTQITAHLHGLIHQLFWVLILPVSLPTTSLRAHLLLLVVVRVKPRLAKAGFIQMERHLLPLLHRQ